MYHKRRSLSRSDWNRRNYGKNPGKTQKKGMIIRVSPNVNLLGDGMVSQQDLDKQVEYILKNNILFIPETFIYTYVSQPIKLNQLFFDISPQIRTMNFDEVKLLEWCSKNFNPSIAIDPRYWIIVPTLNYINIYIDSTVQNWGDIRGLITYSNANLLQLGNIDIFTIDMTQTEHTQNHSMFTQLIAADSYNIHYIELETDRNNGFDIHNYTTGVTPAFQPLSRLTYGKVDFVSTDINSTGKTGTLIFDVASGNNFDGINLELGMYFELQYHKPE